MNPLFKQQIRMKQKQKPTHSACTVVATAHTLRGLRLAASLRLRSGVDVVEVRLDHLATQESTVARELTKIALPLLITARHPSEGGTKGLPLARRRALLQRFLPAASMIDVEIRSARSLQGVLREAAQRGITRILSFHDFDRTPARHHLAAKIRDGRKLGADIVKLATKLRGPADLANLLSIQAESKEGVATMGMGPLGKVSRLVLPSAGSLLVYGYLDRPQVEGQWPAEEVALRLREVMV